MSLTELEAKEKWEALSLEEQIVYLKRMRAHFRDLLKEGKGNHVEELWYDIAWRSADRKLVECGEPSLAKLRIRRRKGLK